MRKGTSRSFGDSVVHRARRGKQVTFAESDLERKLPDRAVLQRIRHMRRSLPLHSSLDQHLNFRQVLLRIALEDHSRPFQIDFTTG